MALGTVSLIQIVCIYIIPKSQSRRVIVCQISPSRIYCTSFHFHGPSNRDKGATVEESRQYIVSFGLCYARLKVSLGAVLAQFISLFA